MKKSLVALALSLAMLCACSGCSGDNPANPSGSPAVTEEPGIAEGVVESPGNPVPNPTDESGASQSETPAPTPEKELVFDESALSDMPHADEYVALHSANPEVIAWITVPNTKIDYGVALTSDNEKYLHTTLSGEESKSGAIFFDYRTDQALSGRHLIIYGHNMKAGTMFHDLNSYKHKEFFENNRTITLWAGSEKREYEVYAAFIATEDIYFIRMYFSDDAYFLKYMTDLQALSKFSTDVVLNVNDQILTLVTCTYEEDNARFVVQAKRVS